MHMKGHSHLKPTVGVVLLHSCLCNEKHSFLKIQKY